MKFSNSIFILFLSIIYSCQTASQTGVTLKGEVENPIADGLVTLQTIVNGNLKNIDSTKVDADGNFTFNMAIDSPNFYRVNIFNRQIVNLILHGESTDIKLTATGETTGDYNVEGSVYTDYIHRVDSLAKFRSEEIDRINQQALEVRRSGDQQAFEQLRKDFNRLNEAYFVEIKNIIRSSLPSIAALYALNYLDVEQELSFADSVVNVVAEEYPNHDFTKQLSKRVSSLKKVAIGVEAPEISLPNPDGNIVTLSSLRGKYVLIDFWAAWCRPCREENPNVVRLYNKYKGENFEILGVSLDRKKEDWIRAIEKDGLTWKHVSDLKYFNSEAAQEYQVNAIPATFLIDPEGNILDKNLRGPSLESKLKELFGA
jgi:peroxiredoxin